MKARYVLWPVMIFGAVSIASACSSSSSSSTGTSAAGADGNGDAGSGVSSGATSSTGATDAGGMTTSDAGATSGATGGASQAGAGVGVGGAGVDLCEGKDLNCPDDNNPCTEDECNPATGECGIPRSDTACDDGLYCNGEDTCEAGECTGHAGTPCSGTCNEAGNYCECATKDDCPADEPGEWSDCAYANECVQTAMHSRPVTKYSCNNVGKCVSSSAVESEQCTRVTEGTLCTDDNNRCNGTEKCKGGNCVPDGADPCKGNSSNPYCYNADPTCRVCKSANLNGSNPVGCSSGQYCCGGECKGSSCLIIVTTLVTTISPTLATFAQ